jgi:hypothetical protein
MESSVSPELRIREHMMCVHALQGVTDAESVGGRTFGSDV